MSYLPIEPYLIELLRATDEHSLSPVITGGLGLYLKRRWVIEQIKENGRKCLFDQPFPDARATEDIDAFLNIEIFTREAAVGVKLFRRILDTLGYEPYEKGRYFQFIKPMKPLASKLSVKIDLHTRFPSDEEAKHLKVEESGIRLSRRGNAARRTVDAWNTSEAFAIEHGLQTLPLTGPDPQGNIYEANVRIPHPFPSLCMKIQAAFDHENKPVEMRKKDGGKHASDVYLLMAMLNSDEFGEVKTYVGQFRQVPQLAKIRSAVLELFRDPNQPSCRIISDGQDIQLEAFCSTLCELFASSDEA